MRERETRIPRCAVLWAPMILLSTACPGTAQLNLGPEEFVKANGVDLAVSPYSVPSFADWNNDGLKDLVIGEGSGVATPKVRVYLNTGTASNPQFSNYFYAQSNGADLTSPGSGCLGLFPRVVSWDGDDRKDLLIGQALGNVRIFLNVNTDGDPAFDGGTSLQAGPPGSKTGINVGARATATVADWNSDGRKDLVVGAMDGRIHLFINEGTDTSPEFRTETFAQNNGSDLYVPTGRSSPAVLDMDGDGKKDLLAGNTEGQLFFYRNTGTDIAPSFSGYMAVTANGGPIDLAGSARSRPFVCDWTADGRLDVLIGAGDGKVHLYQGRPVPADFDQDNDVDQTDLDWFIACATGPSVPYDPQHLPAGCRLTPDGNGKIVADLDYDLDVDQSDFGVFQRCISGESNPADPGCAD